MSGKSEFRSSGAGWTLEAFEAPALSGNGPEKVLFLMAGSWFHPEEAERLRDALTKALDFLKTLP